MDIVLIAGLWLPAAIWDEVCVELRTLGHRPIVVTLPGVDDGDRAATLDDQLAAATAAVAGADRPLVVGHSAAAALAWMTADRMPDAVAGVVLIGGFPAGDGAAYAEFFPLVDGVMAFPGWEPFDGPDSDDLDAADRGRIESLAVPVPEGVATGIVRLADDRRFEVPVTLVCPEFTPTQAQAWIDAGDLPELARARRLSLVDIDAGHWPMVSCAAELARLLDDLVPTS
jgi:pimeloyl-ACP methyl ester carboxylesterase